MQSFTGLPEDAGARVSAAGKGPAVHIVFCCRLVYLGRRMRCFWTRMITSEQHLLTVCSYKSRLHHFSPVRVTALGDYAQSLVLALLRPCHSSVHLTNAFTSWPHACASS
eukprot:6046282-Pleurochrysis_carterae.AAC.1